MLDSRIGLALRTTADAAESCVSSNVVTTMAVSRLKRPTCFRLTPRPTSRWTFDHCLIRPNRYTPLFFVDHRPLKQAEAKHESVSYFSAQKRRHVPFTDCLSDPWKFQRRTSSVQLSRSQFYPRSFWELHAELSKCPFTSPADSNLKTSGRTWMWCRNTDCFSLMCL
jgi:hypothetical protein